MTDFERHVYSGRNRPSNKFHFAVFVDGLVFDDQPSKSIVTHSTGGFAWGAENPGSKQLALAILLNEQGWNDWDESYKPMDLYTDFMKQVISKLQDRHGRPIESFALTSEEVASWVVNHKKSEELDIAKAEEAESSALPKILDSKGNVISGKELIENVTENREIQCPQCSGDVIADFTIQTVKGKLRGTMICPKCKSLIGI